jgi:hypothetical protein
MMGDQTIPLPVILGQRKLLSNIHALTGFDTRSPTMNDTGP